MEQRLCVRFNQRHLAESDFRGAGLPIRSDSFYPAASASPVRQASQVVHLGKSQRQQQFARPGGAPTRGAINRDTLCALQPRFEFRVAAIGTRAQLHKRNMQSTGGLAGGGQFPRLAHVDQQQVTAAGRLDRLADAKAGLGGFAEKEHLESVRVVAGFRQFNIQSIECNVKTFASDICSLYVLLIGLETHGASPISVALGPRAVHG